MGKTRWYHFVALGLLLVVAAGIRIRGNTRYGLWADEYWALYIATARGNEVFDIPYGKVVTNPPYVGFEGAPHFWHIWTGMGVSSHPPFYHMTLRAWIDLFGESDRSIRTWSAVLGLLGIVILFDAVRRGHGPTSGILAAFLMTFAPVQIDYDQQVRPYPLLTCIALLIYWLLIVIKKNGASPVKLLVLGTVCGLSFLTHYFSPGIVVGAVVYAMVEFEGAKRKWSIAAIVLGCFIAIAAWGPEMWHNRESLHQTLGATTPKSLLEASIDAVQRLTFGQASEWKWISALGLAVLVLIIPAFDRSKRLWWIYLVCYLGFVLFVDLVHRSVLMDSDRYIFAAAPAAYAILATPVAGRIGRFIAAFACVAMLIFAIARLQQGPQFDNESYYQREDHRVSAAYLKARVQPGDVVLLLGTMQDSNFDYFVLQHYKGRWNSPVILFNEPLNEELRKRILEFRHVWVSGFNILAIFSKYVPGFNLTDIQADGFDTNGRVVASVRATATTRP